MSEHTPKQHALIGMRHLENAVLDILMEAWNEGKRLGFWEIGKRTGIAFEPDIITFQAEGGLGGSRGIVWGVLTKLAKEKRVQKKAGLWGLTEAELKRRRDRNL